MYNDSLPGHNLLSVMAVTQPALAIPMPFWSLTSGFLFIFIALRKYSFASSAS
jgi:hypothetical protein